MYSENLFLPIRLQNIHLYKSCIMDVSLYCKGQYCVETRYTNFAADRFKPRNDRSVVFIRNTISRAVSFARGVIQLIRDARPWDGSVALWLPRKVMSARRTLWRQYEYRVPPESS
jgi:hypothetical protein